MQQSSNSKEPQPIIQESIDTEYVDRSISQLEDRLKLKFDALEKEIERKPMVKEIIKEVPVVQ